MQSALSAVIAAACRYLGIDEKEPARRFYVDRSAISRATQRVSRDPNCLQPSKRYKENSIEINIENPIHSQGRFLKL